MYREPQYQLPPYALSLEEKRAEAFMEAMQPLVEWTDRTSKIVASAFDALARDLGMRRLEIEQKE